VRATKISGVFHALPTLKLNNLAYTACTEKNNYIMGKPVHFYINDKTDFKFINIIQNLRVF